MEESYWLLKCNIRAKAKVRIKLKMIYTSQVSLKKKKDWYCPDCITDNATQFYNQ